MRVYLGSFFRSDNVLLFDLDKDYTNVLLTMINDVIHLYLMDFSVCKLNFTIKRLIHKNNNTKIPEGTQGASLVKNHCHIVNFLGHRFAGILHLNNNPPVPLLSNSLWFCFFGGWVWE